MALDLTAFYTKAGLAIGPAKSLNGNISTDFATKLQNFKEAYTNESLEVQASADALAAALASLRSSASSSNNLTTLNPVQLLLRAIVVEDGVTLQDDVQTAIEELIRQMVAQSQTLNECTPSVTPSTSTNRYALVASALDLLGLPLQHCFPETMRGQFDGEGGSTLEGTIAVVDALDPLYLAGGSGVSVSLPVNSATDGSLIANGGFEASDAVEPLLPDGWVLAGGTTANVRLTNVEQQTVTISGDPTGGWYSLTYTNTLGEVQTTFPIQWNASGSAVAAALGQLTGLENVSVSTTGVAPNFTHTITFTDVPNPQQLTSDASNLTGGTPNIAHATVTEASPNVVSGGRSLNLISDGSTILRLRQPFNAVQAATAYAVNLWAISALNGDATGKIRVAMIDGAGNVIQDQQGNGNSFDIDASDLINSEFKAYGAIWRTPAELGTVVQIEIAQTTAFAVANQAWLDEVVAVEAVELYEGGPRAGMFRGRIPPALGDTYTLAVGNDRAGELVTWMDRIFDLRQNGNRIPTSTTPTIPDSLIP